MPDLTMALVAASGLFGALLGAGVIVAGLVLNQRRSGVALRRWLAQAHFDLFQDVADCAGEYDRKDTFGVFRDRLSTQARLLRVDLSKDKNATLNSTEFTRVYRSLSSVDYMIFVYDRKFEREYVADYINDSLDEMRETQNLFGPYPKFRPNAETGFISGEERVSDKKPIAKKTAKRSPRQEEPEKSLFDPENDTTSPA